MASSANINPRSARYGRSNVAGSCNSARNINRDSWVKLNINDYPNLNAINMKKEIANYQKKAIDDAELK